MNVRDEQDAMGVVHVPEERYWGAQTQRSLEFFAIGTGRMPVQLLEGLVLLKKAAALTNRELGVLDLERSKLIVRAADEVLHGKLWEEFPLSVYQTGSGTQTNMNVNEVLANIANEVAGNPRGTKRPVHPNDHVNLSQSSNDAFPTAMHIAAVTSLGHRLFPALSSLIDTLQRKARAFADVIHIGRTHLQDATPITLGQSMGGWVEQLEHARRSLDATLPGLYVLAAGGTAVGTGLNCPEGFAEAVAEHIARLTSLPFRTAPNKFAALAAHDALVFTSGALSQLACAAMKIANDVRWLASGPRAGLGELRIPENEPGSSIMPGKVNPTQCEALIMVAARVLGNHHCIAFAGSQGNFELNVGKPLIAHALLESVALVSDALSSFDRHCARGIEPNREVMAEHVQRSLMLATALNARLGYDGASAVARHAASHDSTLRESAIALHAMSGEEFDEVVRPERMLHPTPKE